MNNKIINKNNKKVCIKIAKNVTTIYIKTKNKNKNKAK